MDMRVRGKTTARPKKVEGPTLKTVECQKLEFPTLCLECTWRAKDYLCPTFVSASFLRVPRGEAPRRGA